MLHYPNVENLDELFNELEAESHAGVSTAKFFAHLLHRLRLLFKAENAVILLPTAGSWMVIAASGTVDSRLTASLSAQHRESGTVDSHSLAGAIEESPWFAIPIRPANFSKGCLLVSFSQPLPSAAIPGLLELMAAFAELLALRQMTDLESFFDQRWEKLQQLCAGLARSTSKERGSAQLVNQLVPLLAAARVALVSVGVMGRPRLEAVSGVTTLDQRSQASLTLLEFASQTIASRKPFSRQQKPALPTDGVDAGSVLPDGAFANLVAIPLISTIGDARCHFALVLEWQSYDEMVEASAVVANTLPTLNLAWQQHRRWERVPGIFKLLGERRLGFAPWRGRLVRWVIVTSLLGLAYLGLMRPYPVTIEAQGVLEPAVLQTVFANLDGYVEGLLVEDGQHVVVGQPLLNLRSPELELRIEELSGELRTIREKRSALQIAGNQLNPDAADLILNQNRIASEIKQLVTQEDNRGQQLKMLLDERQKSTVVAPIAGIVVAKDLRQKISSRPLRRGDALFRIVDLDGPWRLRIQVADKDSGYVLGNHHARDSQSLQFVIDSIPGEQFPATINWIASTVQNQFATGCYVEMHANVDDAVVQRTHMGASVRAYFMCGDQPLWFVWCRPLVESIQRRLWFWS